MSEAEQERRITAESRRKHHKLDILETLRELRKHPVAVEQPPVDLEIDTEASSPSDSAARIAERFGLAPEPPVRRYPVG